MNDLTPIKYLCDNSDILLEIEAYRDQAKYICNLKYTKVFEKSG
jgi:hypothetical protein